MSLWERVKANLKHRLRTFVREHIIDDDHHDAREQADYHGYCSGCGRLVRTAELGELTKTEVFCKPCPRTNMRATVGGPPN